MSLIPRDIYLQRLQQLDSKLLNYPLSEDFNFVLDEAYKLGNITEVQQQLLLNDIVTAILYIVIPKEDLKTEILDKLHLSSTLSLIHI